MEQQEANERQRQIEENQRLAALNDAQNDIIKQEVEKEPLIGPALQLDVLYNEFCDSPNFLNKAKNLGTLFGRTLIRRARKDGSCFYRCFIYRLCELLCMGTHISDRFKLEEKLPKFRQMMLNAGFELLVFEDFENFFGEFLAAIRNGSINLLNVNQSLSDKSSFDFYVMYLRFAISAYIRTTPGIFDMYFETDYDLRSFCSREVEVLDAEADQLQIIALFNLLDIPLRIFYLDNNPSSLPTVFSLPDLDQNTTEAVQKSHSEYLIQLLYRPGHYDILY